MIRSAGSIREALNNNRLQALSTPVSVLERLKKINLLVFCRLTADAVPVSALGIGDYSMGNLSPRENIPSVLVRIIGEHW